MNTNPLITVIIPSYNRFQYLKRAIDSVKNQTYKNIEIIIVNDKSTDNQYYELKEEDNLKIIHLEKNTKQLFGYACAGYVRNIGLIHSKGDYITFLDDDDWWDPEKIQKQVEIVTNNKDIQFCCTDGYMWENNKIKGIYNKEVHWNYLKNKMNLNDSFPKIWNQDFIKIHNTIITSSVMIKKDLLVKINGMKYLRNGQEDYDCWLTLTNFTDIYYIDEPLFYYDNNHGDGQFY